MDPWLAAAIGFSLSQVLLALVLLFRLPQRGPGEWLYAALLLCIVCYLLYPALRGTVLAPWVAALQAGVPGMFWLFSACVFDDRFRLRAWQLMLVASTICLPLAGSLLGKPPLLQWLFFTLPQGLEFLLLGLTLWEVARHWRTDLVESRRRLRSWFVVLNATYMLLLIFSREVLFPGEAWFSAWQYLPLAGIWLLINSVLLAYRGGVIFSVEGPDRTDPAPAMPADEGEPALVKALQAHMSAQRPWRRMGLTIGQLAEELAVPQYRLRRAINADLGYRNFSDFLNSYRVREAAERLRDPAEAKLPVLTIAMDAGFRSLSSFNKAFKESLGQTPTAYRKQAP